MKHLLRTLILVVIPITLFAAEPSVPLREGQGFVGSRAELLRAGWKPRFTYLKLADGSLERDAGTAGEFSRKGYREVEVCAGTGVSPCIFNYTSQSRKCLRLYTVGEHPEETQISSWSFECPPQDAL